MKKTEVILLLLLMVIFISCKVSAVVGVSPGLYEVNFQPGLKESYIFSYTFDEGVVADVYVKGDLAEYVTLNTNQLVGSGGVMATLQLPDQIEIPGDHKIYIGAKQSTSSGGTVGIVGNVRGIILVKVPYPGTYASIDYFQVVNANQGDPVNFTLKVDNLGKEAVNLEAYIEVYNDEDTSIEILPLGNIYLNPKEEHLFKKSLETTNYKSGNYRARAVLKYEGGELTEETEFKIGTLNVAISNYTKEVMRNKISPFDVEIESFWNNKIPKVYAEVKIIGYDKEFLTPSLDLNPWQKTKLSGFFDTTGIEEDKFQANITVHYAGKQTNQIVDVKFKKETDYTLYALIGGGIFLGILLISIIIAMIILFMRLGKNGKKS